MDIPIPPIEQQKLTEKAFAAGFDDVERFAAEHLIALAHAPEPEFAPMTEEQLAESLAVCDEGMSQANAGKGIPLAESHRRTREQLRQSLG